LWTRYETCGEIVSIENLTKMPAYKRAIYLSMILIAMGVVIINTNSIPSVGTVFIALGGFYLIVGMAMKKKEEQKNDQ